MASSLSRAVSRVRASCCRPFFALWLLSTLIAGCVGSVSDPANKGKAAGRDEAEDEEPNDSRQEYTLPSCEGGLARPLASGLRIREVALYQTVKIPLFSDGSWLENRTAPVVRDKRALLRVFVEPLAGYDPHEVYAVLRLDSGKQQRELADPRIITIASTDADSESTFNIEIPKSLMDENPALSVTLEEPSCDAPSGDERDARAPVAGQKALDAESIGAMQVRLVPLTFEGRAPSITPESKAGLRAALLAMFPVPEIALSVRKPVELSLTGPLRAGAKWNQLVVLMEKQRKADRVPDDMYYVGLIQPGPTRSAYCGGSPECILGMARLVPANNINSKVAAVAFFADDKSYESVVHELGHAHGLPHAPCTGTEDKADPNFPDPTGNIGGWGWDVRSDTLIPPTRKDVMGYCEPVWIGAYNYRALAARAKMTYANALMREGAGVAFRELLVEADGTARWGSAPLDELAGEREPASVQDASGNEIARIEVGVVPLSHSEAAFVSLPAPGANWSTIVWSGGSLSLSSVLPPY